MRKSDAALLRAYKAFTSACIAHLDRRIGMFVVHAHVFILYRKLHDSLTTLRKHNSEWAMRAFECEMRSQSIRANFWRMMYYATRKLVN